MSAAPRLILHVCVTCRDAPPPAVEEELRAGQLLFDRLARLTQGTGIVLEPAQCLANCARGCSAAISMAGKWSYLLGGLDPSLAEDLRDYAVLYGASATGTIMPSRRAASLRDMIVGRIPSAVSA